MALVSFWASNLYAGIGWNLTIKNETNLQITVSPGGNDCWYSDDLGKVTTIDANSTSGNIYSETKNAFFSGCYTHEYYQQIFYLTPVGNQKTEGTLNVQALKSTGLTVCAIVVGWAKSGR